MASRNHDAVGNTTSIGGKTFTYNDANRMNAVKQGDAVLESYAYNHRGERVLRTPAGGAAQITLYDEAGQWLGNYSATGQAQQQVIWLDNYPVALINMPATGVPELAYVQPDHLGTPRVVIDPVRNVAIWEWSNKSEVFGNQIPSADPDGDGVVFELALRFPGQQATEASGLFYNYKREYGPAVGRYSQSDPIGLAGGVSTYAYVSGNPISLIDPLGLEQGAAFRAIYLADGGSSNSPRVGYHDYNIWVPMCAGGCTPDQAFNAMRKFSAPGAPPAQDGSRNLVLPGLTKGNPINQTVDPCERTIKNVALPGHQFGGSVTISIQQRNGVVGAQIVGTGVGPNPIMNQLMGPMIFEYLGSRAARSLGP